MADDNTLTNTDTEVTQDQPAPEPQPAKMPAPESRFLFVDVAALRAKQLRRGARVRLPGFDVDPVPELPKKPERVAMEEVRQGLVAYDLGDATKPEGEGQ